MKPTTISIKIYKLMDMLNTHIELNGITVACPGNSQDKQLLIKFTYYLFYHIINYRKDVEKKLFNEDGLDRTYQHLRKIVQTFDPGENPVVYMGNEEYLYTLEKEKEWIASINRIEKLSNYIPETENVFDMLRQTVTQQFGEAKKILRERPLSFLMQNLFGLYPEKWELPDFEVWENNELIISLREPVVNKLQTLRKIIYICPPLFPSAQNISLAGKWYHFSQLLKEEINKAENNEMLKKVQKMMKGEVIPHTETKYIYKNEGGKEMNLTKCNQRIKILAIFERLLNFGLLDDQTLIVFEAPEDKLTSTHFREISNLIFELNEELGVKFLLGINNQKLINSLADTGKERNKEEKVNIYYAQEIDEPYKYTFVPG